MPIMKQELHCEVFVSRELFSAPEVGQTFLGTWSRSVGLPHSPWKHALLQSSKPGVQTLHCCVTLKSHFLAIR